MIEDTPEARVKASRDIQDVLDTIRSFEDRAEFPYHVPCVAVMTDPHEDGRDYTTFDDYFAEGEEGETYPDYLNRVGRKFFVIQGHWSRGSTKSLEDVIWKWNCGEAVDISDGVREIVWKQMEGMLGVEMESREEVD